MKEQSQPQSVNKIFSTNYGAKVLKHFPIKQPTNLNRYNGAMIHAFPTMSLSSPLHQKTELSSIDFRKILRNQVSYGNRSGSCFTVHGISNSLVLRSNSPSVVVNTAVELESAADVVRKFYGGINSRDLASVEELISQNCIYEDLVFPRPFVGRKEIMEFFNSFVNTISSDLQFAIDDISEEDTSAVGVTWHLEWKGKSFPFSKGCSFYRLDVFNGRRQIVYGRDVVEPAIKPGESALIIIRGVTWLLEKFPALVDRL